MLTSLAMRCYYDIFLTSLLYRIIDDGAEDLAVMSSDLTAFYVYEWCGMSPVPWCQLLLPFEFVARHYRFCGHGRLKRFVHG